MYGIFADVIAGAYATAATCPNLPGNSCPNLHPCLLLEKKKKKVFLSLKLTWCELQNTFRRLELLLWCWKKSPGRLSIDCIYKNNIIITDSLLLHIRERELWRSTSEEKVDDDWGGRDMCECNTKIQRLHQVGELCMWLLWNIYSHLSSAC